MTQEVSSILFFKLGLIHFLSIDSAQVPGIGIHNVIIKLEQFSQATKHSSLYSEDTEIKVALIGGFLDGLHTFRQICSVTLLVITSKLLLPGTFWETFFEWHLIAQRMLLKLGQINTGERLEAGPLIPACSNQHH